MSFCPMAFIAAAMTADARKNAEREAILREGGHYDPPPLPKG